MCVGVGFCRILVSTSFSSLLFSSLFWGKKKREKAGKITDGFCAGKSQIIIRGKRYEYKECTAHVIHEKEKTYLHTQTLKRIRYKDNTSARHVLPPDISFSHSLTHSPAVLPPDPTNIACQTPRKLTPQNHKSTSPSLHTPKNLI